MHYYAEFELDTEYECTNFERAVGDMYMLVDSLRGTAVLKISHRDIEGTDCPAGECSQCKRLIPDDARYCCYCGARIIKKEI